ncbi:MAG: hypothetical protein H6738_25065 [Alphaproteobacteria bacterium]|nr:hypothetical protein [Alphaproteobacteria bacterium]
MTRVLAATALAPLCSLYLAITWDGALAVDLVHVAMGCLALADLALLGLGLRIDRDASGCLTGALNASSGLVVAALAVPATLGTGGWYLFLTVLAAAEWDSFGMHDERVFVGQRSLVWAVAGLLSLGRAIAWTWATYRRATTTMSPAPS